MLTAGFRLVRSFGLLGAELAIDATRLAGLDELVELSPGQFRRLLLSMEESIQGRIPAILGDDEEERIDTLVRLLRNTSERDLTILISDLQEALVRLEAERGRDLRLRRRQRREYASLTQRAPILRLGIS